MLALLELQNVARVARTLRHARSCINKVVACFLAGGVAALKDRRLEGRQRIPRKEEVVELLLRLTAKQPPDFGWRRSTWTRELLGKEVARQLQVFISCSQLGRMLHKAKIRLCVPKQTIRLAPPDREEQMNALRALLAKLPPQDVFLYSDEVDITQPDRRQAHEARQRCPVSSTLSRPTPSAKKFWSHQRLWITPARASPPPSGHRSCRGGGMVRSVFARALDWAFKTPGHALVKTSVPTALKQQGRQLVAAAPAVPALRGSR